MKMEFYFLLFDLTIAVLRQLIINSHTLCTSSSFDNSKSHIRVVLSCEPLNKIILGVNEIAKAQINPVCRVNLLNKFSCLYIPKSNNFI